MVHLEKINVKTPFQQKLRNGIF